MQKNKNTPRNNRIAMQKNKSAVQKNKIAIENNKNTPDNNRVVILTDCNTRQKKIPRLKHLLQTGNFVGWNFLKLICFF